MLSAAEAPMISALRSEAYAICAQCALSDKRIRFAVRLRSRRAYACACVRDEAGAAFFYDARYDSRYLSLRSVRV